MSKSNLEILMDAIVNGNTADIKPQSRHEEYLLALINGETLDRSPQSRLEVYLKALTEIGLISGSDGGSSTVTLQDKTFTANGTYTADKGYDGLGVVIVDVGGSADSSQLDSLIEDNLVNVNSNAESVRDYCFHSSNKLKTVIFSEALSIGSYAFSNCASLTSANFPKAESIGGANVFYACRNLKNINFPMLKELGENMFNTCTSLENVVFPMVETTGNSGFNGCSKLVIADFPKLTSITGTYLFYKCYSLKAIILRSNITCSLGNVNALNNCHHFTGTKDATYNPNGDKDGYIYVPRDLVESYTLETNWTSRADRFRSLEDYTVDGTITGALDESKI